MHTLKLFLVCMVGFMVLDGIWLGVVMKSFYREQLAPIARMADGGLAPNWPAAFWSTWRPASASRCS